MNDLEDETMTNRIETTPPTGTDPTMLFSVKVTFDDGLFALNCERGWDASVALAERYIARGQGDAATVTEVSFRCSETGSYRAYAL